MSRLVKLLGMLGSDFDGERANAAAMIAKMAKDAKLSIADLVMRGGERIVYRDRIVYQDRIVYRDRVVEKIVYRDRPSMRVTIDPERERRKDEGWPRQPSVLDQLRQARNEPLTEYEIEFIARVLDKYRYDFELSDRQMKVARRIIDKVFGEPLI